MNRPQRPRRMQARVVRLPIKECAARMPRYTCAFSASAARWSPAAVPGAAPLDIKQHQQLAAAGLACVGARPSWAGVWPWLSSAITWRSVRPSGSRSR